MNLKSVTEQFSVAPQIVRDDLMVIKAGGYKTIICHRPDSEESQQPSYTEIKAAALALGLTFHYQPVRSGHLCATDVDDFGKLLQASQAPILAYCRSGRRSISLWAMTMLVAGKHSREELLQLSLNAGYDLQDCLY
ncbi:MAG: TIGR01244 family sulfur transferase [Aestuariibacter sp.]